MIATGVPLKRSPLSRCAVELVYAPEHLARKGLAVEGPRFSVQCLEQGPAPLARAAARARRVGDVLVIEPVVVAQQHRGHLRKRTHAKAEGGGVEPRFCQCDGPLFQPFGKL